MEPFVALAVSVVLLIAVAGSVVHVVEWRLYVGARRERDLALQKLEAVTKDRDGWRGVAERSLLAAQLALRVSKRATRAAVVLADKS